MARKPNCTCTICGTPMYRRPFELERSGGRLYCSQACFGATCRKPVVCRVCGKEFLANRGKKTCSRACANVGRTGIKYKQPGRPKSNRATEARALKRLLIDLRGPRCQRCAFDDVNILVVHHIVRCSDGGTNDPDNLELLCPNCHAKVHYYGVRHSLRGKARSQ